ncbi:hypothetical protein BH09VER1_BH09VER1_28660 [soil metagenome]
MRASYRTPLPAGCLNFPSAADAMDFFALPGAVRLSVAKHLRVFRLADNFRRTAPALRAIAKELNLSVSTVQAKYRRLRIIGNWRAFVDPRFLAPRKTHTA